MFTYFNAPFKIFDYLFTFLITYWVTEKRKRKGSENQNDAKPNTTINNYFLRAAISNKLTKHRSVRIFFFFFFFD